MNTYPSKTYDLKYPPEVVADILTMMLKTPDYQFVQTNETLGTYSFANLFQMYGVKHRVEIKGHGETTGFQIETMPADQGNADASILTRAQDAFMAKITDYLTGKADMEKLKVAAAKGKGCLVVFLIPLAAMMLLFSCKKDKPAEPFNTYNIWARSYGDKCAAVYHSRHMMRNPDEIAEGRSLPSQTGDTIYYYFSGQGDSTWLTMEDWDSGKEFLDVTLRPNSSGYFIVK